MTKKFFLYLWLIFIFILLVIKINQNGMVDSISYFDKIVHFFLFGILSFLIFINYQKKENLKNIFWLSLVISSVYALLMEFIQYFLPWRTCSLDDFVVGFFGSLFFSMLSYFLYVKKQT